MLLVHSLGFGGGLLADFVGFKAVFAVNAQSV
jgi:hypothetical protein